MSANEVKDERAKEMMGWSSGQWVAWAVGVEERVTKQELRRERKQIPLVSDTTEMLLSSVENLIRDRTQGGMRTNPSNMGGHVNKRAKQLGTTVGSAVNVLARRGKVLLMTDSRTRKNRILFHTEELLQNVSLLGRVVQEKLAFPEDFNPISITKLRERIAMAMAGERQQLKIGATPLPQQVEESVSAGGFVDYFKLSPEELRQQLAKEDPEWGRQKGILPSTD